MRAQQANRRAYMGVLKLSSSQRANQPGVGGWMVTGCSFHGELCRLIGAHLVIVVASLACSRRSNPTKDSDDDAADDADDDDDDDDDDDADDDMMMMIC